MSQKLIDRLSRVERMEITFWKEKKVWYLNLRPETVKILQRIGYGKLFGEKIQAI